MSNLEETWKGLEEKHGSDIERILKQEKIRDKRFLVHAMKKSPHKFAKRLKIKPIEVEEMVKELQKPYQYETKIFIILFVYCFSCSFKLKNFNKNFMVLK